jgi:Arc/MetJ-type ribon-helix-helix transcriptional regulator
MSARKPRTEKKSWSIDRASMSRLQAYVKKRKIKSESAVVSRAISRFLDEESAREEREQAAREYFADFRPQDLETSADERDALLARWRD